MGTLSIAGSIVVVAKGIHDLWLGSETVPDLGGGGGEHCGRYKRVEDS